MSKVKRIVYEIFHDEEGKRWYHFIDDYLISSLIVLNVVAILLSSINEIAENYAGFLTWFEIFSVAVFTVEFLLRLWVADMNRNIGPIKSRLKYFFSFYGMIDFLAILPAYLPLFIGLDMRVLRIMRLLRTLRLFKLGNYSKSVRLIGDVMRDKKSELLVTISVTGIILIMCSTFMYEIENSVQPDQFPNIFATLWWAVATLTTIGYGDVYPITGLGKILAAFTALLGIGIVAIPTGIISSGFMDAVKAQSEERKKREKQKIEEEKEEKRYFCPNCGTNFKVD